MVFFCSKSKRCFGEGGCVSAGRRRPKEIGKTCFLFIYLLIFRPSDLEVVEPGFRDGRQAGVSAPRAQPPGRLIWTGQSQLLSRLPSSRLGNLLTI